jgi:hypothetical protein
MYIRIHADRLVCHALQFKRGKTSLILKSVNIIGRRLMHSHMCQETEKGSFDELH